MKDEQRAARKVVGAIDRLIDIKNMWLGNDDVEECLAILHDLLGTYNNQQEEKKCIRQI